MLCCLILPLAAWCPARPPAAVAIRSRPPPRMGKKHAFESYALGGDHGTSLFPVPAGAAAVRPHKKFKPRGCSAQKVPAGAFGTTLPTLAAEHTGLRVLHLDPPVLVVDDFLTAEECDAYVALRHEAGATHELAQSATFATATASARTSTTWFVQYQRAAALLARAANLLGVKDLSRFEEPQLVRYRPGQSFSWHYDEVPSTQLHNGGQRVCTLLVYLNDVAVGGRTAFRDLRAGGTDADGAPSRLEVAPRKGRALVFCPAAADGTADERTPAANLTQRHHTQGGAPLPRLRYIDSLGGRIFVQARCTRASRRRRTSGWRSSGCTKAGTAPRCRRARARARQRRWSGGLRALTA